MKAAIMHLHRERQRRKGDATRCKTRRDAITSPPVATQHMSWAPLLWCVLSSPCRGRSFITVCALMDRREAVTLVNDQYLLPPAAQLIDRVLCGRSLCGGPKYWTPCLRLRDDALLFVNCPLKNSHINRRKADK